MDANSPPVTPAITTYLADKGKQLNFSINADDPDGDPLIYFAGNLPSGATFNPATKIFSWTPNHTQIGDHTIRFMVSDGILSDSRDVKVIVNNVNQPPVFDAISARNVNPDLQCHFTVNAIDPDGDSLSYTANNLPAGATFEPTTKTFSWTPDDSQTGSYRVKFTVSDGVASNTMDVSVTVSGSEVYGDGIVIIKGNSKPNTDNNVNRQPVFNPLNAQSIDEEKLLQFSVNAIDPNGDSLIYTADNLPPGADFDQTSKTFSWTPELGQAGSYRVSFTVSDGKLVDSQDVVINVNIVDAEIGLNYFGARFYDPEAGRFLTTDTYTFLPNDDRFIVNCDYFMYLSEPQEQNGFSYCENNPINRNDPDEHWAQVIGAIAGAAINVGTLYISDKISGEKSNWGQYVNAAGWGAFNGALFAQGGTGKLAFDVSYKIAMSLCIAAMKDITDKVIKESTNPPNYKDSSGKTILKVVMILKMMIMMSR